MAKMLTKNWQLKQADRQPAHQRCAAESKLPVVLLYGIDPSWSPEEKQQVIRQSRRLGFAMRRRGHSVRFLPVSHPNLRSLLSAYEPHRVVIFNWCEELPGRRRSEHKVAETLEALRFTYTGAPPEAIRLSYDKPRLKRLLQAHGVPTPRWKLFRSPEEHGWDSYPAIVKLAREHCSIGMDSGAVVFSPEQLRQRLEYVINTYGQPALVEDFIDGPEYHVPLLGNDPIEMLPPVERDFSALEDPAKHICSYNAKFVPDSEEYQKIRNYVPARLSAQQMAELEAICKKAYRLVGCRDYGRIDVRMRDGQFYVLDVNPNADISHDASLALAAQKAGYCYGELGSRLVALAAQRHPAFQNPSEQNPSPPAKQIPDSPQHLGSAPVGSLSSVEPIQNIPWDSQPR
ncbi:MAG: hypothetical protein NZ602_00810 [Thermoguttaceae bacterium]|nr:hypothetical protein [Thermoguttaceae bacterium]MDW8038097.1 hypothetical protein [Thermoguttaceae bacterium]